MSEVKVSVSLTLDDNMSAEATKALRDLVAAADKTGKANKSVGDAAKSAGKAAAQAGKDGAASTGKYVQGLRSAVTQSRAAEKATRAQTSASRDAARQYENTARAARNVARVQKDLADAVRKTDGTSLSRLSRALDGIAARTRTMRAGFGSFAKNAALGMAQGVGHRMYGAATSVSLRPAIDYERRLAMMSNTAFADRKSVEGRNAGAQEIRAAVDSANKSGGGTREEAADALEAIIGADIVSIKDAMAMLPVIQKFATGTGSASKEIADIAIRGIQQGYFKPEQIEEALDNALVAGQSGGFELKDMARWLPQLMANAQGMKSMEGFKSILAASQASVTTAGDTDQAGNNLVNLLAKLNSKQLADALKNKHNVNLANTLAAAREKGMLPLDAFIALLNMRVIGKDKRYQALQARAQSATGADKEQALADMGDIVQASAIGEVLADRQAVMALVALMNNPAYMQQVKDAMANSAGAGDLNLATIQATTSAKGEQASNALDAAKQKAFDTLSPALNALADGVAKAAETFPRVTSAATAAATALMSLAAIAGVGYLMRSRAKQVVTPNVAPRTRTRNYRNASAPTTTPAPASSTAAAPPTTVAPKSAAPASGNTAAAIKKTAATAVILSGVDMAVTESNDTLTREEKNIAHAETVGGAAGALALGAAGSAAGAKLGASLGLTGGPIGAAIGGLIGAIGGLIGYYAGAHLGLKAGESIFSGSGPITWVDDSLSSGPARPTANKKIGPIEYFDDSLSPGTFPASQQEYAMPVAPAAEQPQAAPPAPKVTNNIRVVIDGKDVVTAIEERMEREGYRGGD